MMDVVMNFIELMEDFGVEAAVRTSITRHIEVNSLYFLLQL